MSCCKIPAFIGNRLYRMELAAIYSIGGISGYCACCYTGNLTILVEGNLAVDYGIAILHVDRCTLAVNHTCSSCCTIQCHFSIAIADTFDANQILVQLNFNLSAVMAYADVLVAAEINITAGFYVGCFGCNTVGGQVPAFICICSYLSDFFQLAYIYSIIIINAFSYVGNYFIISIQTFSGNISFTAIANALIIIHEEVACLNAVNIKISVQCNVNKSSIIGFFLAYGNISIVTAEVNGSTGFNFSRVGDFFSSRKIPACIFSCSLQLCYVYSIGSSGTSCYVGDLTSNIIFCIPYGNSTFSSFPNVIRSITIFNIISFTGCRIIAYHFAGSSVSYAANAQSNAAFYAYACTIANSNCIISCNCIFMTEGNNIAYASDCVFVAHYNRIGNISQFIVRTCHEYVMATFFIITGKFVIIADNGRIGLFGNSVGTADYCYSTALLFSENRIVTAKNSESIPP